MRRNLNDDVEASFRHETEPLQRACVLNDKDHERRAQVLETVDVSESSVPKEWVNASNIHIRGHQSDFRRQGGPIDDQPGAPVHLSGARELDFSRDGRTQRKIIPECNLTHLMFRNFLHRSKSFEICAGFGQTFSSR
jgi:hypothetical protein